MMWPYYGGDGWSWLWGAGMMVLFLIGVIFLGFWALRSLSGPGDKSDTAMETLRRRLASGEISPEDFEKTKKALGA